MYSETEDPDSKLIVEFFDRNSLHNFLLFRKKSHNGILQRFIPPKGNYNFMIKSIWSP